MRSFLAFAAAALLAATSVSAGDVTNLTPENFDSLVGGDAPALVKFFAPWCGHCKSMAADYETVASLYKSDPVVVGEVNADDHKDLASRFGVRGYPTLKYFPAGSLEPEDYNGGRTADDFVSFINGKAGLKKGIKKAPEAVQALTPETFDAVVSDPTKHKLVEFYAPWCGHCKTLAPIYDNVAKAFAGEKNVVVAKVDADKWRGLGERFGVQGFPTLKYFPAGASGKLEDVVEDYEGGRDGPALLSFLNEKAGTHRNLDGSLAPSAGRLPDFDELAKEYVNGDAGKRATALGEAKELMAQLSGSERESADVYVKAMEKIEGKGAGYVATETARLDKLIANDATEAGKRTTFQIKRNVLQAFKA